MSRIRRGGRALAALLAASSAWSAHAQTLPAQPGLVVIVVVDQFCADFLDRFAEGFGKGGFARLTSEGARYVNAHFSHGVTVTAPGHACISTGANPRIHGIAANAWVPAGSDRMHSAVHDPTHRAIGSPRAPEKNRSPANLLMPTLGDQMKLRWAGRSLVVSVSLKDRSAVLLGGKQADGAFWWDSSCGAFLTSTYYFGEPPSWLLELNRQKPADQYLGRTWDLLLPRSAYAANPPDDRPFERGGDLLGNTFPHRLGRSGDHSDQAFYQALASTPYGNELLLKLVARVLKAYPLGGDEVPDLLCVGLTSNDACGHLFGPYSWEVQDMTLRSDRQLAELFELLDQQVGKGRWLVAVTSDHGVAPIPEFAVQQRLGGGRFSAEAVCQAVRDVLDSLASSAATQPAHACRFTLPWLHLDAGRLASRGVGVTRAAEAVAETLSALPFVERAYPFTLLESLTPATDDPVLRMARQAYYPGRSGHVYVHVKPYFQPDEEAANHGTAYSYDTHVPLLLYGPGIAPGVHFVPADPIDIVPTLCALLGLEPPPGTTGRVLVECLSRPAR